MELVGRGVRCSGWVDLIYLVDCVLSVYGREKSKMEKSGKRGVSEHGRCGGPFHIPYIARGKIAR